MTHVVTLSRCQRRGRAEGWKSTGSLPTPSISVVSVVTRTFFDAWRKPGTGFRAPERKILALASLPLYPAIRINLDAAVGQGTTWAIVAIGFVIFGAVCIEHATHSLKDRQFVSGALWAFLGFGFLARPWP